MKHTKNKPLGNTIDKLDDINIDDFCSLKNTIKRVKREATNSIKISATQVTEVQDPEYVKNSYESTREIQHNRKMQKKT